MLPSLAPAQAGGAGREDRRRERCHYLELALTPHPKMLLPTSHPPQGAAFTNPVDSALHLPQLLQTSDV